MKKLLAACFLLIVAGTVYYRCVSIQNHPAEGIVPAEIEKLYTMWRDREIKSGMFRDLCGVDDLEDITVDLSPYALPEFDQLIDPEIAYPESQISSSNFNNDAVKDYLIKIVPENCYGGNMTYGTIYLLFISGNNGYVLYDEFANKLGLEFSDYIEKQSEQIDEFDRMRSLEGFMTGINVIYDMKMGDKGTITGSFCIYVEDDANCCPSFKYNFTAHFSSMTNATCKIYQEHDSNKRGTLVEKREIVLKNTSTSQYN
ncbi:MAG: hypothetical protein LBL57_11785 [Tannerella sp.]|jgi:hypothetical protein|nr:hypothetical protein [Tannerella sp.]